MQKTITVHWQLTPIQLQFKPLLQWTSPEKRNPTYTNNNQLQQCGCCAFIRMKVFETHKETYYVEIESDSIEYDSLYDTLKKYSNSLTSESLFNDKLDEVLEYLEDEL